MADSKETHARAGGGDPGALHELVPLVHDELRALAARHFRRERPGHTLQTTALVNEAYLRMLGRGTTGPESRAQFFALAAGVMRNILVDHARRHAAEKRGGRKERITLAESLLVSHEPALDLLDLHTALERLAELDPRQARVVELRFFAGLAVEEIASVLGVSPSTIKGDWRMARAWLRRELGGDGEP